jgi:hypothetical protein
MPPGLEMYDERLKKELVTAIVIEAKNIWVINKMKWDKILLKTKYSARENFFDYRELSLKVWMKFAQLLSILMAWMKSNEIQPIFDHFPSLFNNIYLKSFGLSQNLTKNYEILQKFMIFFKVHEISWYNTLLLFSFDVLCWLSLLLLVLLKVGRKILVSFRLIQNFEIYDLAMAKVKKSISQLPRNEW